MNCSCTSTGKIPHWLSDITDNVELDNVIKYLKVSDRNPMSIDNLHNGFKIGNLWLNAISKEVFICVDFIREGDVGIWRSITNEHTPVYTARDPLADKDTSLRGFRTGTLWINSVTNNVFLLLSVTDELANWKLISNLDSNEPNVDYILESRDPTNEDRDHKLFTFWINSSSNNVFLLINRDSGMWTCLNETSIDGGTY